MATKFLLYWGSGSPPCWRAMLVAEEKQVQGIESKLLEFSKKEHKGEEVLKWNPRGELPTVVVDGSYAINESLAIAEFLDRVYAKQGTQLTPEEPRELARVLQRKYEYQNLNKKAMDYIHYVAYSPPGDSVDANKAAKLKTEVLEELKIWDKYAGEADYIAGDKLSLADLVLFPDLAISVRYGLDLASVAPSLHKYYERMIKLPSVQKTWPPHWKDSAAPKPLF